MTHSVNKNSEFLSAYLHVFCATAYKCVLYLEGEENKIYDLTIFYRKLAA